MSENGEIDVAGLEDTLPMEPDHEACYRALSTRDARFDGLTCRLPSGQRLQELPSERV
jgi:hypothetical protein